MSTGRVLSFACEFGANEAMVNCDKAKTTMFSLRSVVFWTLSTVCAWAIIYFAMERNLYNCRDTVSELRLENAKLTQQLQKFISSQ